MAVRVGISTYGTEAHWAESREPVHLLPATYIRAVEDSGGVAVLLPSAAPGLAADALRGVDALVLAGGPDLDPSLYGQKRGPHCGPAEPARDAWERALLTIALGRDLPVLGVCRGMQMINVHLGGTLVQHLSPADTGTRHCGPPGGYVDHLVTTRAASLAETAIGSAATVASRHHQALDRLGAGVRPIAWAEDGVVEAVEVVGHSFAMGVQWHPEVTADGTAMFKALTAHTKVAA